MIDAVVSAEAVFVVVVVVVTDAVPPKPHFKTSAV